MIETSIFTNWKKTPIHFMIGFGVVIMLTYAGDWLARFLDQHFGVLAPEDFASRAALGFLYILMIICLIVLCITLGALIDLKSHKAKNQRPQKDD